MIKYRQREGYTHARLLQTVRPLTNEKARGALFRWAVGKAPLSHEQSEALPLQVRAHIGAMASASPSEWARWVRDYDLPWEALPTAANSEPDVIRALLNQRMGLTALIRNLGNYTRLGVLTPLSDEVFSVCVRLSDPEELKRARIHPFNLLLALKTYELRTWPPRWPRVDAGPADRRVSGEGLLSVLRDYRPIRQAHADRSRRLGLDGVSR